MQVHTYQKYDVHCGYIYIKIIRIAIAQQKCSWRDLIFWTKLHFKEKKFGIYNFQRQFRIPFCEQLVYVYNNITESNVKNTFSA